MWKEIGPKMWALYLLLVIIFISGGLLALHSLGVVDLSKFRLNLEDSDINPKYRNLAAECPKTLAEMKLVCCKPAESGEMRAAVSAVYVSASCKECPSETHFLRFAPEGNNIMICQCDACPG